jgi:RNA polymerase sigma-70 factor (ECF subfamily)
MGSAPLARHADAPQLRLVPGAPPSAGAASTSDPDLVASFRAAEPGSGARLYDRLFPVVDVTLVRILGRRESDHADLVQATFEQIVSTLSRRTYEQKCSLVGWARALACHVGLNALRSRRRERAVIDRRLPDDEDARGRPDPAAPADAEARLQARDQLEAVRKHLASMAPERVTAVLLHAMGHDLEEIAALTSTSLAAAQSRLSRGRRELRAHVEGKVHEPEDRPSGGGDDR